MQIVRTTIRRSFTRISLIGVIVVALTLSSLWPTDTSHAQFEPAADNVGPGQTLECRAYQDWSTFISATLSYDSFYEYWNDILYRYNSNICHYYTIDTLLKRIDKVRKQIRNAFYSCADTTHLTKIYYELEAELFFVRKYINTSNGSFYVVGNDKVISELRNYFVLNKNYYTDEEILTLFDRFTKKYTPKLKTYANCKDSTWQALVDKWNEFKEKAGGFGPALKEAERSFEKRWARMSQTSMNLGRSFFGGFVDAKINGLSVKEGWEQIAEELEKNAPGLGVTIPELQAAKSVSDDKVDFEQLRADYEVQYKALYKETSDEFTARIVDKLDTLNSIIESTYPFENQTIHCVKTIVNKQC